MQGSTDRPTHQRKLRAGSLIQINAQGLTRRVSATVGRRLGRPHGGPLQRFARHVVGAVEPQPCQRNMVRDEQT